MIPPMKAALTDPRPGDQAYVRQVVFLTDGGISNEQELFSTITNVGNPPACCKIGVGWVGSVNCLTNASDA